ncbi:MAG: ATP-binding protein [Candidatus Scalindua sp.]|nr:ATP-binding protein [Candidatus Scalindua sp.]
MNSDLHLIYDYEEALGNVCNVLFSFDVSGNLLSWHDSAEELFGYLREKVAGKNVQTLWPQKKHPIADNMVDVLLNGAATYEFVNETPISGKSASQTITTIPIRDQSSKVIGATCVSAYMTHSKKFLQSVLDGIEDSIKIVDRDFNIILYNEKAAKEKNGTVKTLIGKKCYKEFWSNNEPCSHCVTRRCFETNKPQQTTDTYLLKEKKKYMEFFSFPIKNESGKTVYVIEFERDITEREELEQKKEKQREELGKIVRELQLAYKEIQSMQNKLLHAEKLASVGQITSCLAHELDSPLTTISGYCELIEEDIQDENTLSRLEIISNQVTRCQKTIRGVLDYARKSKDIKTFQDINTLIKKTISLMGYVLKVNRIRVVLDLDDNLPRVHVQENQMQQVFFNLLRNAIDSMPDGGEIAISSFKKDGKNLQLTVKDTGHGVSEAEQKSIFEPFFTTKDPGKGTGLGLSICTDIVRSHGGNITVESRKGEGASFIIILPVNNEKIA